MSRARMIDIDGAKLENEIQRRGVTKQEASTAIGKEKDYLTDCIRTQRISMPALEALYRKFFISEEDLMAEQKEEPEQAVMMAPSGITKEDILEAVADGICATIEILTNGYELHDDLGKRIRLVKRQEAEQ